MFIGILYQYNNIVSKKLSNKKATLISGFFISRILAEDQFISGCKTGGIDGSTCSCIYDKLEDKYGEDGLKFDWVLEKMINEIAVGKKTLQHVYEYYSVDVSDLRKKLFAIVNEAGAAANVAALCLELIDELSDEYGSVDTAPRHPDIESGRPWPLVSQGVS